MQHISLENFVFHFLKGKCVLNNVGKYFLLTKQTEETKV